MTAGDPLEPALMQARLQSGTRGLCMSDTDTYDEGADETRQDFHGQ
jgi:hypothetical protein